MKAIPETRRANNLDMYVFIHIQVYLFSDMIMKPVLHMSFIVHTRLPFLVFSNSFHCSIIDVLTTGLVIYV